MKKTCHLVIISVASVYLLLVGCAFAQQTQQPVPSPGDSSGEAKRKDAGRGSGISGNHDPAITPTTSPMTAGQKLRMAAQGSVGPYALFVAGLNAGFHQACNWNPGFGQGAAGYGKRFAASFADRATAKMLSNFVLPSVLHQDPRYFRSGAGSHKSRTVYSLTRILITRTDSGGRAFNWSKVLGSVGSGAISNAYYPREDRGISLTLGSAGWSLLSEAGLNCLREFWPDFRNRREKKKASKAIGPAKPQSDGK